LTIAAWSLAGLLAACSSTQQTTLPTSPQSTGLPIPTAESAVPAGPVRVGLLLPLTGDAAGIGADMLDAAQLALFDMGGDDILLLPRDTGDSPDGAVQAAQQALDAGAQLLLGPLFGQSTPSVAALAAQRNVRVLAFSNDASVAGRGAYVLGYRPEEQVQRVVSYARAQGKQRIAALVPDDAYGRRTLDAWRMAGAGATGAAAMYPVSTGDAASEIQRMVGPDAGPDAADALLLPDTGVRLQTLLGLLSYYRFDPLTTRLLGTMRWRDDSVARSDPTMRGAWMAAVDPQDAAAFASIFANAYGREPNALAGLAYDATALAAVLARSRQPIDDVALTAPEGFAGRLGIFRLLPSGIAEHGLAVVELNGGDELVVDPAPRSFAPAFGTGF
jgi:ABC-type branched-subunit amino acid transport system substrate-binding protein